MGEVLEDIESVSGGISEEVEFARWKMRVFFFFLPIYWES